MTKHTTLPKELCHTAERKVSNDKFIVYGEFSDGLKREAHNLTGPQVLTKLVEYNKAGATVTRYVTMPKRIRTVWGGYDKYS